MSVWSPQAQEGVASPLQSTGAAPDVGEAELADVALVWRECQNGRTARSRARTSVTSLYSSGEHFFTDTFTAAHDIPQ